MCKSEMFKSRADKQIAIYHTMLDFLPTIKAVAEKFNGKVINKRFADALTSASEVIELPYGRKAAAFSACFSTSISRTRLSIELEYLNGAGIPSNFSTHIDLDRSGKLYGSRMDAKAFSEAIDDEAGRIREAIEKLRFQEENFDSTAARLTEIFDEISAINKQFCGVFDRIEHDYYQARILVNAVY